MESFDAFYVRYREPVLAYFARRLGKLEWLDAQGNLIPRPPMDVRAR